MKNQIAKKQDEAFMAISAIIGAMVTIGVCTFIKVVA